MTWRQILARGRTLLIIAVALLLIAVKLQIIVIPPYYDPFTAPDLREEPYWLTSTKLQVLDFDANSCASALGQAGVSASLLPPTDPTHSCHLQDTVMMQRLSVAKLKPEQTRCNLEARLYMWAVSYTHLTLPTNREV